VNSSGRRKVVNIGEEERKKKEIKGRKKTTWWREVSDYP